MLGLIVATCLSLTRAGLTHWHGYNESLLRKSNPKSVHSKQCKTFHQATRPYSSEFYEKLSLWSDVLNFPPSPHGEALYGSEEALQMIHDHQNPVDCKTSKYLIFGGWAGGFGSRIHFEGVTLSVAMELGRVYLPHPDGDNYFWETNVPYCKDRKEPGFNCYFIPPSKCTYADALASTNGDVNKLKTFNFNDLYDFLNSSSNKAADLPDSFNLVYESRATERTTAVNRWIPSSMDHILHCSPLRSDAHVYWWRAVSATYLMRPNAGTKEWLTRLSNNISSSSIAGLGLNTSGGHSYFNSPNSVAIHVRHGDKMREMKLVPWTRYAETLQFMVNRSLVCGQREQCSSRSGRIDDNIDFSGSGNVFLVTEDDKVLREADLWSQQSKTAASAAAAEVNVRPAWNVLYSTFFNRSAMSLNLPLRDQKRLTHNVHHDDEYVSMLHNLMYAVRCHSYICTLASNSCRLIDELRCTIGAKCNRPYADLSRESCYESPCIVGHHGYIYNFQN